MTKIYFIVGESSGDLIAADFIKSLKKLSSEINNLHFKGIGGPLMEKEGLQSLFPMGNLSIMGFWEVLRKMFFFKKLINKTVKDIIDYNPDIIVTVDSLGFNKRVVKLLRQSKKLKNTKFIHYVAPTVWVWKEYRAKELSELYDHLFCLFEFEIPYFTKEGLDTVCVGHPIVSSGAGKGDKNRFLANYSNIKEQNTNVLLMPGSRLTEVSILLPILKQVIDNLENTISSLQVIIPTLPHLKDYITRFVLENNLKWTIIDNIQDKYDSYQLAKLAVIASGTTSLELMLIKDLPVIVAYKVGKITYWIAKLFVKAKYASIINIMSNREILKEFIQNNCTVDNIAQEALKALEKSNKYYSNIDKENIYKMLFNLGYNNFSPNDKAATEIVKILQQRSTIND